MWELILIMQVMPIKRWSEFQTPSLMNKIKGIKSQIIKRKIGPSAICLQKVNENQGEFLQRKKRQRERGKWMKCKVNKIIGSEKVEVPLNLSNCCLSLLEPLLLPIPFSVHFTLQVWPHYNLNWSLVWKNFRVY